MANEPLLNHFQFLIAVPPEKGLGRGAYQLTYDLNNQKK